MFQEAPIINLNTKLNQSRNVKTNNYLNVLNKFILTVKDVIELSKYIAN